MPLAECLGGQGAGPVLTSALAQEHMNSFLCRTGSVFRGPWRGQQGVGPEEGGGGLDLWDVLSGHSSPSKGLA